MTSKLDLPRVRLALLALAVAALFLLGPPGLRIAIGYLSPFLLLLGVLLAGRYPGERLIARARGAAPARRAPTTRRPAESFAAFVARGGRLLAFALAGRAPPEVVATTSLSCRLLFQEVSMFKRTAFLCAAVCLVIPAAAQAHISVHPNTVPEGAFATLNLRVPGEEEGAYAYKVDTQFPPGFTDVAVQNVPGWTAKVVTKKLAKPIETDDGPVTEEVSQVIWTGDKSVDGRLDNGTFMQFPISVAMPEGAAGSTLQFKTLETYSNGKVARWIGSPSAEFPSPTVDVTAKGGVIQDVAGGEAGPAPGEAPEAEAPSSSSSGGASKGLGIAALILGALGLLAGGAALARTRRA